MSHTALQGPRYSIAPWTDPQIRKQSPRVGEGMESLYAAKNSMHPNLVAGKNSQFFKWVFADLAVNSRTSAVAFSVTVRRRGVWFGEMTDAGDYYQNPGFHKPGCRHAGLPESASLFL